MQHFLVNLLKCFEWLEIPAFCKYIPRVYIYKNHYSIRRQFKVRKKWKSWYKTFLCTFLRLPEMRLAISKTYQFITLQGKINVQFIFCDRNMQKKKKIKKSALNLTIICINPFTCNNTTFSISFLNDFLNLNTLSLTPFKTLQNTD